MRRAFSLVELLFVVLVVSILLAMIGASVGQASRSAKETRCQSNLRQLYTASFVYQSDHRGVMPSRTIDGRMPQSILGIEPDLRCSETVWYVPCFADRQRFESSPSALMYRDYMPTHPWANYITFSASIGRVAP